MRNPKVRETLKLIICTRNDFRDRIKPRCQLEVAMSLQSLRVKASTYYLYVFSHTFFFGKKVEVFKKNG